MVLDYQKCLFACVVTVCEFDINHRGCLVAEVDINLDLRDGKVWKCFKSILDGVSYLISTLVSINENGTGIVNTIELISESEVNETLLQIGSTSTILVLCESTGNSLFVVAEIIGTLSFGIITFRAHTQRAIVTFITSIAVTLLVLQPGCVDAPGASAGGLRMVRDLATVRSSWSLAKVVERVRIGSALTMTTAVVGACGTAAAFASER